MSASLTRYRGLIPAHAGVDQVWVEPWLEAAARAHTAAVFGAVYVDAMVCWAAAHVDVGVKMGVIPVLGGGGSDPCAVMIPVDGDGSGKAPKVEDSVYWTWYLGYRRSRAGTGPRVVGPRGVPC